MKLLLFMVVSCLISLGCANEVLDTLVDNWLSHARYMMTSTMNHQASVNGLAFTTKCGAFMTWGNCSVTVDEGVLSDLSSLKRYSSVSVTQQNDSKRATVTLDLVYDPLELTYPNMIISGLVNMKYKRVRITPTQTIPFTLHVNLDYTDGVENCVNNVHVTPPALPKFSATVIQPSGIESNLPMNLIQPVIDEFVEEVSNHISSLIGYENVCSRLANLI